MTTRQKIEWSCTIPRKTLPLNYLYGEEVFEHPLKTHSSMKCESRALRHLGRGSMDDCFSPRIPMMIMDPLGSSLDGEDPLSIMAAETEWDTFNTNTKPKEVSQEFCLKPWEEQRAEILMKFTTSQKLSMMTSFLPGGEKVTVKSPNPVVRNRLEQLDDFEEGSIKEMGQLSQQEYTESINQLNRELVQAWHQDFRVKALKITIQCSKLLVDTSVIQFYPSKFVLITDILDIFGKLVYDRLWRKAEYYPPGSRNPTSLPENFTADMVPESAKETCRNWFYKIASIRELVPRLYVEAAILKSYSFLTNREFSQALMRLTKITRGIGDPLVAIYARCYLCRVGMSVSTLDRQFLKDIFYDYLAVYDQLFSNNVKKELNKQKVDIATYLGIHSPALKWILQGLSQRAPQRLLDEILEKCSNKKNMGLLLDSIMTTFKPSYISAKAAFFIKLIASCKDNGFPHYILLRTLGECFQQYDVENPKQIYDMAWKLITDLSDPVHFMACAQVWAKFIVKNFPLNEVNNFLADIIKHVGSDGKMFYPILREIITIIITNVGDFDSLFTMDKLLPLLDLLDNEETVYIAIKMLETFTSRYQQETTADPITINALIFIAKILHDSVNALSVDDIKRQIGVLISHLIRKINFGRDFEKQLDFYVEARGTFTSLDSVHITLVHCVNKLSIETGRIVKSHHTRKTASFVRACAAYCYITIPSISSEVTRLKLYLQTALVALFNQCLGQAEACIKQALNLLPELPKSIEIDGKMKSSETFLNEYVCNTISALIVVPDCPEQGVLYLTRGLVNMLQHYMNDVNIPTITKLYLSVIDMLVVSAQPEYPYHIKKVDSNDVLYGSDPKFILEINKMCGKLAETILSNLVLLGSKDMLKEQAQLAFDLFFHIVTYSELEAPGMASLALNLWNLSQKHNCLDSDQVVRTRLYLKRKSSIYPANSAFSELVSKLS